MHEGSKSSNCFTFGLICDRLLMHTCVAIAEEQNIVWSPRLSMHPAVSSHLFLRLKDTHRQFFCARARAPTHISVCMLPLDRESWHARARACAQYAFCWLTVDAKIFCHDMDFYFYFFWLLLVMIQLCSNEWDMILVNLVLVTWSSSCC